MSGGTIIQDMFDARLRPLIDPPLDAIASTLEKSGLSANFVTVLGFGVGLGGAVTIAYGELLLGLILILINRVLDGLDGALARRLGPTDFGGFLDIVLDFLFYSAIPLSFAVLAPGDNAVAAAFLIFSFMGTGSSFLAFAVVAAKHGLSTEIRGRKSFYYLGGLTEGAETIAFFIACCIFPERFAMLAYIFGALCWVTTATRIAAARTAFQVLEKD